MRVQVSFMVPIEVVVDLDTGAVNRVVVIDEEIELDYDGVTMDELPVHGEGYTALEDDDKYTLAKRAVEIATTAEWPGWEFGW